jgi:hypothetical protein
MSELDGKGHQLLGLIDGETEHQTLVAGAQVAVDTGRDVGALLMDPVLDFEAVRGEIGVEAVVADTGNRFPDDAVDVDRSLRGHLPTDDGQTSGDKRLAGNPCSRGGDECGVEDAVRDGISHLVRMTFGHRFRCEIPTPHERARLILPGQLFSNAVP